MQVTNKNNALEVIHKLQGLEKLPKPEQRRITYAMAQEHIDLMPLRAAKGISSDGTPFKPYSTKPAYFIRKRGDLSVIKPLGKLYNGKKRKKFESGKKKGQFHRSMFLESGYSEYRRLKKRSPSDRLYLTGRMQGNLKASYYSDAGSAVYYPREEENQKAIGNQKKYRFFFPTKAEKVKIEEKGKTEMAFIMKKLGFEK